MEARQSWKRSGIVGVSDVDQVLRNKPAVGKACVVDDPTDRSAMMKYAI